MTYVFDIDGTICSLTDGKYDEAVPHEDRIAIVNKLYDEGHTILFNTARGMGRSGNAVHYAERVYKKKTEKQLREWGVKFHRLFTGKPSGDVYIDDKAAKDDHFFETQSFE
jgi:hypothetical protein